MERDTLKSNQQSGRGGSLKQIVLTQVNASSRGKSRYDWLFALFAWRMIDGDRAMET